MSSIITIQPCKFEDHSQNCVTYGYRCYDGYGSTYNNLWEEKDMELSPIEILEKVFRDRKGDDTLVLMFDFLVENELGIFVGLDWLEWDQIKEILT